MTDEQPKKQPDDMSEQGRSADNDGGPVSDYIGGDTSMSRDASTTTKPEQGDESTDEEKPGL